MLTVGIVLFVVGALVALAARPAGFNDDRFVRLLGIAVAVIGLVLILIAVVPSDGHDGAVVLLGPVRWRRSRPRRELLFWPGVALAILAGCVEALWLLAVDQVARPGRLRVAMERRLVYR